MMLALVVFVTKVARPAVRSKVTTGVAQGGAPV
jgi:hypothetical protein